MSTKGRGLSVRARLTIAMAAVAAIAFALVALVAPGVVRSVLEDDLLVAEAETAAQFVEFGDPATFDPDKLIDLTDEDFFPIDSEVLFEVGDVLSDIFGDFKPFDNAGEDAERVASEQIALLRSIDRLELLTDAAGGAFAIELSPSEGARVEPDGSFAARRSAPRDRRRSPGHVGSRTRRVVLR